MSLRRRVLLLIAGGAVITALLGVQAVTSAPSAPSALVTIDPARILDTREANGVPGTDPVGQGETITLQVTGRGGVPAGATGVIITLTATDATVPTYITATPTGTPRATTSVLNPGSAAAIANTVTMSVGVGGGIDLFNFRGSVHLVADVSGYLLPSGSSGIVNESIELSAYSGTGINLGPPNALGCVDLGDTGELYLDVPLPHGAAVQSVTFRWFDDDTANMTMLLSEINSGPGFSSPTGGNLVGNQGASTGAAGYGQSTLQISAGDATSDRVRYQIVAFTLGQAAGNTFHRFCGATVDYARSLTA